jgi:hypothetical protein
VHAVAGVGAGDALAPVAGVLGLRLRVLGVGGRQQVADDGAGQVPRPGGARAVVLGLGAALLGSPVRRLRPWSWSRWPLPPRRVPLPPLPAARSSTVR